MEPSPCTLCCRSAGRPLPDRKRAASNREKGAESIAWQEREHLHADRKGMLILPWMLLMATMWPWRLRIMEGRSAGGAGGGGHHSPGGTLASACPAGQQAGGGTREGQTEAQPPPRTVRGEPRTERAPPSGFANAGQGQAGEPTPMRLSLGRERASDACRSRRPGWKDGPGPQLQGGGPGGQDAGAGAPLSAETLPLVRATGPK